MSFSLAQLVLILGVSCLNSCLSAPPLGFYPNIIIFYADDLGFGDLSNYGHPTSLTPNLDRLTREGTKVIEFYSSSPVCSPSRAALLTGRFQTRNGVWPGVFGQSDSKGLPLTEITIASLLKSINGSNKVEYNTGIIGKWHLGVGGENGTYLPTNHGFDFYTGIPYSHDMPDPLYCFPDKRGCWPDTWPDPWNNTHADSYTTNNYNYVSIDSNGIDINHGNYDSINSGGNYSHSHSVSKVLHEFERKSDSHMHSASVNEYGIRRRQIIKQRLIQLGIVNETFDIFTSQLSESQIDSIPVKYRMSENMDIESLYFKLQGETTELPLYLQNKVIQQPVNITAIPDYYTLNAKYFINNAINNDKNPFFLYFASHETHHPQFSSSRYFNKTQRGMFGDSLSELDYNIGVIIDYLYELGIENDTLIIFSSDNGPSYALEERGGNTGLLKCGKGTTWEGGVKVPGIFWMPKYIESNRITRGLASTLDIFPTIAQLVDLNLPQNITYDGYSMFEWIFTKNNNNKENKEHQKTVTKKRGLWSASSNTKDTDRDIESDESASSLRNMIYFWPGGASYITAQENGWWTQSLHAVRMNQFKLHLIVGGKLCADTFSDIDCRTNNSDHLIDPPILFNLYHDPGERYPLTQDSSNNVNNEYYQNLILKINQTIMPLLNQDDLWGESQISGGGDEWMPCCNWGCVNWPQCCNCAQNISLELIANEYWNAGV